MELIRLESYCSFAQAGAREGLAGFEAFDEVEELVASMMYLGYTGDLTKLSTFNKKHLPHLYNNLFTILNRCLTRKNSGIDIGTHPMVLFLQGIVQHRHYDYAQLIFSDLVEMVTKKKKSIFDVCLLILKDHS